MTYPCSDRAVDIDAVYTCTSPAGHDGDHQSQEGRVRWTSTDSAATRKLAEIRNRAQNSTPTTQVELDREALLETVDRLRAQHARAHDELMRRGNEMARLHGELAAARPSSS